MSVVRLAAAVCVVAVTCVAASIARSQDAFDDAVAMTQFQRRADTYAFQHRQVQRRLGEGADQSAMANAMRSARPEAADGDFFTPIIAAAFRNRIAIGLKKQGCRIVPAGTPGSEVPRVGILNVNAHSLPECLLSVLPRLPQELEYREAGVVIILLDTHANLVVDVLHGAFHAQEDR